jgi:hypothetical protein
MSVEDARCLLCQHGAKLTSDLDLDYSGSPVLHER